VSAERKDQATTELDMAIVGAGFSGLYMLYRARRLGFRAAIFERGPEVGGTWYWNRYPGCRCDAQSIGYSYSFSEDLQQEWTWSERYAPQPEILSYLQHVAERFDLRRDIRFETSVESAHYDQEKGVWKIATDRGDASARFLVMATGNLTTWRIPSFPGMDEFAGEIYHTARWPEGGLDLTGKRVGVVGTGSSGIQLIPNVAREAEHLYVFQRTPHFTIPARNHKLDDEFIADVKRRYPEIRQLAKGSIRGSSQLNINPRSALEVDDEERRAVYEQRWKEGGGSNFLNSFTDLLIDEEANDTVAEFVRGKIRETVKDPEVAAALSPSGYPLGAKRIVLDTNYYETYNRENVTLVDVRKAPIEALTETGVRTAAQSYELDVIVFATGYDAFTGALAAIDIRGRDGLELSAAWGDGPRALLGVQVAGFPNMFTITGPQSPSVLSSMVSSIEQHVDWVSDLIRFMDERQLDTVEADEEAQEAWVAHVVEAADRTLFPRANSWYTGSNVPGKPRIFMPYVGGVGRFRRICDAVAAHEYEGFAFSRDDDPAAPPAPFRPWSGAAIPPDPEPAGAKTDVV
jgi:cyclohexanone monooxygenase